MFRSFNFKILFGFLAISFGMVHQTSYADQALEDALKTIDNLFPGQLITNPFEVNWYKVGDQTKLKSVKAKGIPGETAIRFDNKKAKTNTWDAIAASPLNAAISENEVIYVAFWAKGKKRNKDQFSQATVRIAENKAPYAHIINEEVEFTDSWALYYLKGRAPRSFQTEELEFALHMGLHKQSVDVGQYYVINLGTNGNTDSLPIYTKAKADTKSTPTVRNIRYPASTEGNTDYDPGKGYSLVWADEFNEQELNVENWNRQVLPAGQYNEEWQRYTDSTQNAYTKDGFLVIKALHESDDHGLDRYTSGRLNTGGKQAWQYGKIVARIQLPYGEGAWPAFWMLGANSTEFGGDTQWPACGEIDILELYGSNDDAVVEGNIHYAGKDNQHKMLNPSKYSLKENIFADNFHVFEIEWTEKKIEWKVDGKSFGKVSITDKDKTEFHQEFAILLNIAVGGAWAGRPDNTTPFPLSMYVDWVRVYQKS